ncbi:MAG: hypothetical protein R3190_13590, partial [Thermoanaerobaculia bacterium]|nr:hypothetical protein [Thermoanaerobaculia bacterium]
MEHRRTAHPLLPWAAMALASAHLFALPPGNPFAGPLTPDHPWFDVMEDLEIEQIVKEQLTGDLEPPENWTADQKEAWRKRDLEKRTDDDYVNFENLDDPGLPRQETRLREIQQQVARDFRAAIAAKEKCTEEGDAEAERLIERMEKAREYLEPKLSVAEDWYKAMAQPGFFDNYSSGEGGGNAFNTWATYAEEGIRAYREVMQAIDDQIDAARSYDPCGGLGTDDGAEDANPPPPPELGPKLAGQLLIMSDSGVGLPTVEFFSLPDFDDSEDDTRIAADTAPDDTSQEAAETITPTGTYVVKAPCHEEKVVSGEQLLTDDGATLEGKEQRIEFHLGVLRDPTDDRDSLNDFYDDALQRVDTSMPGGLAAYEPVRPVRIGDAEGKPGWGEYKVVLIPKRRPCPDAVPQGDVRIADNTLTTDTDLPDDFLHVEGNDNIEPPAGDDDPSTDPPTTVPTPSGTVVRTVAREEDREPG